MSCCGQKMSGTLLNYTTRRTDALNAGPVVFEYTGRTSLNVVGPATGAKYFFARQGARVGIHPRDAAALHGVPVLLRVNQVASGH